MIRRALAVAGVVLAGAVTVGTAVPAAAAPTASAGHKVCTINDQRITAISGLAATAQGYDVINNTGDSMSVYQLDGSCQVTNVVTDPNTPREPQDLAATSDGTLWVADVGDKDKSRDTIALWKFPSGNSPATLYRMQYPSGVGPVDARSVLMQPNGTPVVVTYQAGAGKVYVPSGKLSADSPTPLKAAGSIPVAATGTPGSPIGPVGQRVFTGGAVSPDGKRAVLRTYTDAYEWDVTGGDVAKSIVSGKPRRTPLPNETGSGEAISYSKDGASFLTVGDTENVESPSSIVKYAPSAAAPPASTPKAANTKDSSGGGLLSGNLSLSDITGVVIAVGVVGLLLVVVGVVGIRRSRRRGPSGDDDGRDGGPDPSPRGPRSRRSADSPDEVETAYIPRVSDSGRGTTALRGESPSRGSSRRGASSTHGEPSTLGGTPRHGGPASPHDEPPTLGGASRHGEPPSRGASAVRGEPVPRGSSRHGEPPSYGASPHDEPPTLGGASRRGAPARGGYPHDEPSTLGGSSRQGGPARGAFAPDEPSTLGGSSRHGEPPSRGRRHSTTPTDGDAADTEVFGRITDNTPPPRRAQSPARPPAHPRQPDQPARRRTEDLDHRREIDWLDDLR